MRRRVALLATLLVALLGTPPAFAVPDSEFSLLPATGEVAGVPGATVGWGYTITNPDDLTWLALSGISADPFTAGAAVSLFDFPTLAPGASVTVPFVADTQGLFQLTWDLTAPVGTVETGTFLLTADWYDADPFTDGQLLDSAATLPAAYVATVAAPPDAPVPEPSTLLLAASGFATWGVMAWRRGRRRE